MSQDTKSYIQLCSAFTKLFRIQCQFRSFRTKQVPPKGNENTSPWASPTLSFRMASKESGKISEFFILRVYQDSFHKMMSGFAESIIV